MRSGFWRYYLPALLWLAAIFVSSSIPSVDLPHIGIWNADKLIHFGVYFLLAVVVDRAVRHQTRFPAVKRHHLLFTIVLTVLYGLSDEFHQFFVPGRDPSLLDLLADAGGAVLFILLFLLLRQRSVLHRST